MHADIASGSGLLLRSDLNGKYLLFMIKLKILLYNSRFYLTAYFIFSSIIYNLNHY